MNAIIKSLTLFFSLYFAVLSASAQQSSNEEHDPLNGSPTAQQARTVFERQMAAADDTYLRELTALQAKHKVETNAAKMKFVQALKGAHAVAMKADRLELALHLRQMIEWYTSGDGSEHQLPKPRISEKDRWIVLFKSGDPSLWNTDANGEKGYAIKLDSVPDDIQYLRMSVGKHAVFIPISKEALTALGESEIGWQGRNTHRWNAHQLGIYVKKWNRHERGMTMVCAFGGRGWAGWGFGVRVMNDDRQGFSWNGRDIPPCVFEIAVTTDGLTSTEQEFLAERLVEKLDLPAPNSKQ